MPFAHDYCSSILRLRYSCSLIHIVLCLRLYYNSSLLNNDVFMYCQLPDTEGMGSVAVGVLVSSLVVFGAIVSTMLYFIMCFDDELGKLRIIITLPCQY